MLVKTISQNRTGNHSGFTLVELMVVLVIFGILVGAGVPALQGFLSNMASRTNADQLATAISFTRQTAVSRGESFTICSNNGSGACGSAAQWGNGWIVYPTANTADIIKLLDTSKNKHSSAADQASVTFSARGEVVGSTLSLVVCDADSGVKTARVIQVRQSGSINSNNELKTTCSI